MSMGYYIGEIYFLLVGFGFAIFLIISVINSKKANERSRAKDHCPICKSYDREMITTKTRISRPNDDVNKSATDTPEVYTITYKEGRYKCSNCKTYYGHWTHSSGGVPSMSEGGCQVALIAFAIYIIIMLASIIASDFFGVKLF